MLYSIISTGASTALSPRLLATRPQKDTPARTHHAPAPARRRTNTPGHLLPAVQGGPEAPTTSREGLRRCGMWGRHYWGGGRRPSWAPGGDGAGAGGVVVMFAWLSSQERHVRSYVELYAAHGWACLVCHSDFLTLYGRPVYLVSSSILCQRRKP